jgi:1-acyl-sn-glycerol-3-phosphate acyltransferase
MATLRSIWIWAASATIIALWLPLVALVRLFDRDPARYTTGRWFRRIGHPLTRVNPNWKIELSGDLVSDPRRPYVVVGNHQSLGDIPIISRLLPWEMKWVAKAELFRVPFIGWMMQIAGDIPVDRQDKMSGARAFVHAKDYLQKNCSVMFFPEGTRSPDGRVYAFTDGAFRLAIKSGLPILPLALDGAQDTLPKHSWKFGNAKSRIRLKVLPPVETGGLKASDTAALRDRVRGTIIQQIADWRGVTPGEVDAGAQTAAEEAKIKNSVNTPAT